MYSFQRQADEHDNKIQQPEKVNLKPIQKVSPRVRCTTVENIVENSSTVHDSLEGDHSPCPPTKQVFILKPINSNNGNVPIHYEIVQVNSNVPINEFGEVPVLDFGNVEDTKLSSKNQSSEDLQRIESTPSKYVRSENRLRKTPTPKDHIKSYFSTFDPDKSREKQINLTIAEKLKNKYLAKSKQQYSSLNAHKIIAKYLRIKRRSGAKRELLQKLCRILQNFKRKICYFSDKLTNNKLLLTVVNSIQTLNIYVSLLVINLEMASSLKRNTKDGGDDLNRKSKCIDDVAVENQDANNPCHNTVVNVATKRNPKAQRTDNTRLMLLPEAKEDINEKDSGE